SLCTLSVCPLCLCGSFWTSSSPIPPFRILYRPAPFPLRRQGGRMESRFAGLLVLLGAGLLAVVSARDYAGCWNDGSRLATVECLVDSHTLTIDRSIFVQVPPQRSPGEARPYSEHEPDLLRHGTGDKLFINGHYYSDKSPVPALLMAGVYQVWQWL